MPSSPRPRIEPFGEQAVVLRWPQRIDAQINAAVHRHAAAIRAARWPWLVDVVPAYASLLVVFDPLRCRDAGLDPDAVRTIIAAQSQQAPAPTAGRVIELPVRYGSRDGPDLEAVARHAGLSADAVVARHAGVEYTVAMLGFAPGFPYLLGLDPQLAMPRRASPRAEVAAGSVGIAGAQTGIYPHTGPGGWQLIGRISARLFDPAREPPCLLQPGDRVRFVPSETA